MTDIANINAFKRIDVLLKNSFQTIPENINCVKKRRKRMLKNANLHDNC
jgi:hypothetical protein